MKMKITNLTIRWPLSISERVRRYQRDHVGLHTKTSAVLVLLDQALTNAGYPVQEPAIDSPT